MIEKVDPLRDNFLTMVKKHNELVDIVNELQNHIADISKKVNDRMIGCTTLDIPKTYKVDPYAEERKWEGKLCWFWDEDPEDKIVDVLSCIDTSDKYPYVMCDHQVHYKHCEPVKPDDDIIYKGDK